MKHFYTATGWLVSSSLLFWLLRSITLAIAITFLVTRVLMTSLAWLSCGEWCPPCSINIFVIIAEVRLRMHGFATSCLVKAKQQSPISQARVQRNQVTLTALLSLPFCSIRHYYYAHCCDVWWRLHVRFTCLCSAIWLVVHFFVHHTVTRYVH